MQESPNPQPHHGGRLGHYDMYIMYYMKNSTSYAKTGMMNKL